MLLHAIFRKLSVLRRHRLFVHSLSIILYDDPKDLSASLRLFLHNDPHIVILFLHPDAVDKIILYHRLQHELNDRHLQIFLRALHRRPELVLIPEFKKLHIFLTIMQFLRKRDNVSLLDLRPECDRQAVKHLPYFPVAVADRFHTYGFQCIIQEMRIDLALERAHLRILLFNLRKIPLLDMLIQIHAHFVKIPGDHIQLVAILIRRNTHVKVSVHDLRHSVKDPVQPSGKFLQIISDKHLTKRHHCQPDQKEHDYDRDRHSRRPVLLQIAYGMVLTVLPLFHIGVKQSFQFPLIFRLHDIRDLMLLRRAVYQRLCIIIYDQLRTGIVLPDRLELLTPESKDHTPLNLHSRRITDLFQIGKAVFSCQVALFQMPLKFFISCPSVALSVPCILCDLIPFITKKGDMVQASVCLERIQEKILYPFILIELILNVDIQTVLLIEIRFIRHIMQYVVQLHI